MSQQTINSLSRAAQEKSFSEATDDERIVGYLRAKDLQEVVDETFKYALEAGWGPAHGVVDMTIPYISDELRHQLKDTQAFKNALARKRA